MSATRPGPIVLHADEGDLLQTQVQRLVKASAEGTDGKLAVTIVSFPPATEGPPLHVHHRNDEVLYVLEGEFLFQVGDERLALGAGAFAYIPSGTPHAFSNLADRPGKLIEMFLPADFEPYFREVARLLDTGAARDEVAGLHKEYELEVVGPFVSEPHEGSR